EDLSEEEADDASDDVVVDAQSQISEIPETQSVVISGGSLNRVPAVKEKIKKRTEKAWLAAKELVDSEQRYVDKLRLLDEVRISDVLRKRAPFLKMYSEYTNNYKLATKIFDECLKKKRRFAQIVHEIEVLF
ncbi:unnamed protein product, partial [Gongylonema pulchrum]|uniref:DH domain-containing protein n=1 Tax=Gongylonema pulchrum TaxID=637853 RepID=A0A183DF20_9BILA